MMIDLQAPLKIYKVLSGNQKVSYRHDGRFWWIAKDGKGKVGSTDAITIFYEGKPRVAVKPPWDGGIDWNHDAKGRPWISTACQGIGASIWWPCKDIQSDEPEQGADLFYTIPADLSAIANGKLVSVTDTKMVNEPGTGV